MRAHSTTTLYPIILSGGGGTRLWPLSRSAHPKQFQRLCGPRTMLQETVLRLHSLAEAAAPLVVSNEEHRFLVAEQLREIGLDPLCQILEPVGRNTAPAVGTAALYLKAQNPNAVMIVLPADHVIRDVAAFQAAVLRGMRLAEAGHLVTFGIVPEGPETGYGYIQRGAVIGEGGAMEVAAFTEKPDRATAEDYVRSGAHFWNSGIFMFRPEIYLAELARLRPDIHTGCVAALAEAAPDSQFLHLGRAAFAACPAESIDYAVMEHTEVAVMVPLADIGWSDVGSWDALWAIAEKDEAGNLCSENVIALDTRDSFIRADTMLVATLGLDKVIVVQTADAVLVAARDKAQGIKDLVAQLKAQSRQEQETHLTVHRPWGWYKVIERGPCFQVKQLMIKPGQKISLQKHQHRAEHWVVVEGVAKVTRDRDTLYLTENQSTYIGVGVMHRLENTGDGPLKIIEVQSGSYLAEDDIVRFDDVYNRDTATA